MDVLGGKLPLKSSTMSLWTLDSACCPGGVSTVTHVPPLSPRWRSKQRTRGSLNGEYHPRWEGGGCTRDSRRLSVTVARVPVGVATQDVSGPW